MLYDVNLLFCSELIHHNQQVYDDDNSNNNCDHHPELFLRAKHNYSCFAGI